MTPRSNQRGNRCLKFAAKPRPVPVTLPMQVHIILNRGHQWPRQERDSEKVGSKLYAKE